MACFTISPTQTAVRWKNFCYVEKTSGDIRILTAKFWMRTYGIGLNRQTELISEQRRDLYSNQQCCDASRAARCSSNYGELRRTRRLAAHVQHIPLLCKIVMCSGFSLSWLGKSRDTARALAVVENYIHSACCDCGVRATCLIHLVRESVTNGERAAQR